MPWQVIPGDADQGVPWGVRNDATGEVAPYETEAQARREATALNAAEHRAIDIREAAAQANAEESLAGPFRRALAATLKAASSATVVTEITAAWEAGVVEHIEPELIRQVRIMAEVSALNNSLNIDTVPPGVFDTLVGEHIAGVIAYGSLIEGLVFKRQTKNPEMSFSEAVGDAAAPERGDRLAEGLTVHVRNGVEVTMLSVAASSSLTAAAASDPFDRRKMWVSMRDDRVRKAHSLVDGETVPVSGVFLVGGYSARYPGDPSLPPALRINCRCFIIRADGVSSDDNEVAEVISSMVANRREKLAAARRARELARATAAADEAGISADTIVNQVAESVVALPEGGALIADVLEASPEAAEALAGGGASGLLAALEGNPSTTYLLAFLLGLIAGGDEKPQPDQELSVQRCLPDVDLDPFEIARRLNAEMTVLMARRALREFVTSGPDYTDGVMVCVRPTDEQAAQLTIENGLPVEEMHCTLAFFGTTDELGLGGQEQLQEVINEVAEGFAPLEGEVTGVTMFEANDSTPLVALVDAPGLSSLRDHLYRAAKSAMGEDHQPAENHDFMPHITLGYEASEDLADLDAVRDRVGVPLTFGFLELTFGTEITRAELTGTADEETAMTMIDDPTEIAAAEAAISALFSATPDELAEGDTVTVDDSDLVGIVASIVTDGPVTDSQGNSMDGTADDPAILLTLLQDGEPTDVTMVARAAQLTPAADATEGDAPETPDQVAPDAANEATVEGEQLVTLGASRNAQRSEANDYDWTGVLVVEGIDSGDRRRIAEGALDFRDLPLPLMIQLQNPETGGHALAVIAGSIWRIERLGNDIVGWGFFDSGENGIEARRLLEEGTIRGVSVDLDMVEADIEGEENGDPRMTLTSARVMGATLTPFPAFQEANIEVLQPALVAAAAASMGFSFNMDRDHLQVWSTNIAFNVTIDPALEPLVADGVVRPLRRQHVAPLEPPAAWFAETPEFDHYYGVEVELDGRVHGFVTDWSSCHIGFPDRCVLAPRSTCNYAHFRQGSVVCDDGSKVRTGVVYIGCGHADLRFNAEAAMMAMSNAGNAVADVVPYDTPHGIYIAGALRPNATPVQIRAFRGAKISPDWRPVARMSEMVGLVVVNSSGFVPAALVASAAEQGLTVPADGKARVLWDFENDQPLAMVAVGMVIEPVDPIEALTARVEALERFAAPMRAEQAQTRIAELTIPASPRRRATEARSRIKHLRSN